MRMALFDSLAPEVRQVLRDCPLGVKVQTWMAELPPAVVVKIIEEHVERRMKEMEK